MSLPPKELLAPFPWKAKGNTVVDAHGRTVCVVFARNATANAYWLAEAPKLALDTHGDVADQTEQVEALRDEVMKLRVEIENLREENWDLAAEMEEMSQAAQNKAETKK